MPFVFGAHLYDGYSRPVMQIPESVQFLAGIEWNQNQQFETFEFSWNWNQEVARIGHHRHRLFTNHNEGAFGYFLDNFS